MSRKLSGRFWAVLTIFSFTGQVAWVVENMYFNVFIYKMFHASATDISLMVAASAVMATLTTLFVGAWSDKVGHRKIFMSVGYILWGLSILSFALIRTDVIEKIIPATVSASTVGVSLVIILDCVMTFFGSSANDAAFNAWLTDSSAGDRRGAAEGINAMMPLVSILAVFGGFMFFDLGQPDSWVKIFLIIGTVVLLIGILGIFLIRDTPVPAEKQASFRNLLYGFYPSVMRKNPLLYLTLLAFAVFGISIQVFMPYLILYYTEALHMENYVQIMAPAILLASLVTAFYGRLYDKHGFQTAAVPAVLMLMAGYAVLFGYTSSVPVFIGSMLMMTGYLAGTAVFGAMIRDNIPAGRAGVFQGLRICGQVLIPGIIGPFIGSAVLSGAEKVTGNDGTLTFIPNRFIFLAAFAAAAVLWIPLTILFRKTGKRFCKLTTPWAEQIPEVPFAEYPRPQLRRESYITLNGSWRYGTAIGKELPTAWREIRVPFPPESALSGIGQSHRRGETLVYSRRFTLPEGFDRGRVLLHFGAVDQMCRVTLNGQPLCEHQGGYLPFEADVTAFLRTENELIVRARDDGDTQYPWGKQRRRRGGMWYTGVSGIWQSVWLESVPTQYLHRIRYTPALNGVRISVESDIYPVRLTIHIPQKDISCDIGETPVFVEIPEPHLWSPEDPFLYAVTAVAGEDRFNSYFALRTVSCGTENGIPRILLNGHPYFFNGLLDQGYWPDGLFLPPMPEAYEEEICRIKKLGYNMLRKHIKVEPELFYYACDRLGMVVFQDMVNSGEYRFFRDTALPTVGITALQDCRPSRSEKEQQRRMIYIQHCQQTVETLYNHPSILYWTVFNEGWGQFDSDEVYDRMKKWDSTRIVDSTSGWFQQHRSDVESLHVYFRRITMPNSFERPVVLSEYGGYSCCVPDHVFNPNKEYGYKKFRSVEAVSEGINSLFSDQIQPLMDKGLSAAVYTQVSDVEDEVNGLFTYDRRVLKVKEKIGETRKNGC